jgi:flap endonuclease-1
MGIKGLSKNLKKFKYEPSSLTLKKLKFKTIGIDTSIFLYKFSYHGNFLFNFLQQLLFFLENNITPVYIFDGKPTEEKAELIKDRREAYAKKQDEIKNLNIDIYLDEDEEKIEQVKRMTKNNVKISRENVESLKKMLDLFGVYHYTHDGEADLMCRYLFQKKIINYVITEDMDFLTHGCSKVIRGFKHTEKKFTLYSISDILDNLNFTQDQFIDYCILLGCDYTDSVCGIGPVSSYNFVKKYKTIEGIIENEPSFDYSNFKYTEARNMFKCEVVPHKTVKKISVNRKKIKRSKLVEFLKIHGVSESVIERVNKIKNRKPNLLDLVNKK